MEGCFTGYSSALDRTVLKKDRFLDPPPGSRHALSRVRNRAGAASGA